MDKRWQLQLLKRPPRHQGKIKKGLLETICDEHGENCSKVISLRAVFGVVAREQSAQLKLVPRKEHALHCWHRKHHSTSPSTNTSAYLGRGWHQTMLDWVMGLKPQST